jgi:predicted DNA-binding WGR domain protein
MGVKSREITLYFQDVATKSDKVYKLWMERRGGPGVFYDVIRMAGRRGSTLQGGPKNKRPLSPGPAYVLYDATVREKRAKGYREAEPGRGERNPLGAAMANATLAQLTKARDEALRVARLKREED